MNRIGPTFELDSRDLRFVFMFSLLPSSSERVDTMSNVCLFVNSLSQIVFNAENRVEYFNLLVFYWLFWLKFNSLLANYSDTVMILSKLWQMPTKQLKLSLSGQD